MICEEYTTPLFGDGLITPANVSLLRGMTKADNSLQERKGSGGTRRTSSFESVFASKSEGSVGSVVTGADGTPWTVVLNSPKVRSRARRGGGRWHE